MTGSSGAWSKGRTVAITATLAGLIAVAVMTFCSMMGIFGYIMVDCGAASVETLTQPDVIVGFIAFGSAALATILAVCLYRTLGRPLRQMTAAMQRLAKGDFDVRMEERGSWHLREVDEFSRAFNTAAEELAGTEMMRAGFISDFSHEFRTPISSLTGFAQLLQEDGLSEEERSEYLQIIADESQRLAGLSERILLLSKMEASAILPDAEDVDVAETVRRAAAVIEPEATAKNVELALSLDECRVRGNAAYLVQLWMNLLDNAVKFSPERSCVSVALYGGREGEEGRVATEADHVTCWVSDEGPGMDGRTREHLFDRFYQGDTSHASEGSGLGLALCKRIAELHGGAIEASSIPGKGSSFEVKLPSRV